VTDRDIVCRAVAGIAIRAQRGFGRCRPTASPVASKTRRSRL
jgi:hypothetical protein